MGNAAALKAWQALANAERVVAIELLAAVQAVEFHLQLEPGAGGRAACRLIRGLAPRLLEDRSLAREIERVAEAVRSGELVAGVEAAVGTLM